jgi:Protein of unknown function (DUF4058)
MDPARSPFPGMDPWLEHPSLWPNVHQRLITYASDALQTQLAPRYYVSIGERVYLEEPDRSLYPDVQILERGGPRSRRAAVLEADDPVVLVLEPVEVREVFIEIQDPSAGYRVVTAIEVLSPSNKEPGPGRDLYLRKQAELLDSNVHLVEIDLLRAGRRTVSIPEWKKLVVSYCVVVSRAPDRLRREVYPVTLRQRLPRVRIPLKPEDPDAVLDLQAVLEEAYAKGAYALRVSYSKEPAPALSAEDAAWARELAGPR